MFMTRLPRRINMCLIRSFERNRLSYMVLVFPVYQLLALLGIGAVSLSFDAAAESVYFLFLCVAFVILIGVPILMSWHLSCLLFFVSVCYSLLFFVVLCYSLLFFVVLC